MIFISQLGHFGEHLVQMYQIHILNLPAKMSYDVIGLLAIEWVHVIFITWVLFGAIILLTRYPKNIDQYGQQTRNKKRSSLMS